MIIVQLLRSSFTGLPVYLWSIIFIGFTVNLFTLKDGHNWGDDFAQYIAYARNLLAGRPLSAGILMDLAVFPPPGYSFFLFPGLFFFGLNFLILKIPGVFFWYAALPGVYKLFARRNEFLAALTVILLACSDAFFLYKQNILTDIPFLFFLVWALFFWERYLKDGVFADEVLFLFFLGWTLFIRSSGIFLVLSVLLYDFFISRRRVSILLLLGVVVSVLLLQFFLVGASQGDLGAVRHLVWNSVNLTGDIISVVKAGFSMLVSDKLVITNIVYRNAYLFWYILTLFLFLPVLGIFFYRAFRRTLSATGFFSFIFMIALFLWGVIIPHPYSIFGRYFFPLMPSIIFYSFSFLYLLPGLFGRAMVVLLFLIILIFSILNVSQQWSFNDDNILLPQSQELFDWVRKNIPSRNAVLSPSPRALSLMTGCKTVSFKNMNTLREKVIRHNISYLIVSNKIREDSGSESVYLDDYYNHILYLFDKENIPLHISWQNEAFTVFFLNTDIH